MIQEDSVAKEVEALTVYFIYILWCTWGLSVAACVWAHHSPPLRVHLCVKWPHSGGRQFVCLGDLVNVNPWRASPCGLGLVSLELSAKATSICSSAHGSLYCKSLQLQWVKATVSQCSVVLSMCLLPLSRLPSADASCLSLGRLQRPPEVIPQ